MASQVVELSLVAHEVYTKVALLYGRPSEPCGCGCGCPLHRYPESELCLWCRSGTHAKGVP